MFSLYLFCPEVFKKFLSFYFQKSHKLIDSQLKSIKISSIHPIILIIHEMLKDIIADESVISQFQYVFTEIVHSLKVAIIRMVEGKGSKDLYHFYSQFLIPTQGPSCVKLDDFSVFCELRDFFYHSLVN